MSAPNGVVVTTMAEDDASSIRKRAWKEQVRDQLFHTPSKRRRRIIEELISKKTEATEEQCILNNADLPSLDYSWSEDELLELLEEMERDWEQEELEYLAELADVHHQQEITQTVEEFQRSLERDDPDPETVICPLCLNGDLYKSQDGNIMCPSAVCSMELATDMSLNDLRGKLSDVFDLHAEGCIQVLQVTLTDELMLATCTVCETKLSII